MQKWSRFSLLWCEAAEAFGGSHDSESEALQRLVDAQHNWTKPQLAFLDHTKLCLTGSASLRHGHARDGEVACSRECYKRATMLEPLVRDLIDRRVPGDLLAAGVYRGGLAVYMAALVHTAACHLIDGSGNCRSLNPSATIRTVYVADTLPNMSPLDIPYASTLSRRRARKKRLPGLGRHNSDVDHHVNTSLPIVQHAFYSCLGPRPSAPVEYLPGFFGHPSTSATNVGALSLLSLETHSPKRIRRTLETLYPRLSVGGYVVFDGWGGGRRHTQAEEAVEAYRKEHHIKALVMSTGAQRAAPFDADENQITFWRKGA